MSAADDDWTRTIRADELRRGNTVFLRGPSSVHGLTVLGVRPDGDRLDVMFRGRDLPFLPDELVTISRY